MSMGETAVKNALVGNVHLVKQVSGYSAYEVAVANGFKGTQKEWLESLKGDPGYTPRKGIDYFDGEKGEPGSMELHGELNAQGQRIMNVGDPVDDLDAVNKKYLESQKNASKDYVDDNFVKKDDQLNANNEAVVNVATPVNDTDAVNKKYVHDTFQSVEDISADFVSQTFGNCNVVVKKVYKQGKVICADIGFTSSSLPEDANMVFNINNKYVPRSRLVAPVIAATSGQFYLNETMNAYIDNATGIVQVGRFEQTEGFTNNFLISFTYICI